MAYLIDVYLSPSTQEHNPCILGDVEETHMNKICDEMIPYLQASGVTFARNDRVKMTHWESALDSNKKRPRMHYAMHTNANSRNPNTHGQRCYYRPIYSASKSVANTLVAWEKKIYRDPVACKICVPMIKYTELYVVKAEIAIIDEFAYHTNREDMKWLHGNYRAIAKNKVQAICAALGKKFVDPYESAGGGGGSPTPKPEFVRELSLKTPIMFGTDIRYVQQELINQKYFIGKPDGYYDQLVADAVYNFQKANGLVADRIVGIKTWTKLFG